MTILYLTSRARYFRDLSKIYYIRTLSLVVVIKEIIFLSCLRQCKDICYYLIGSLFSGIIPFEFSKRFFFY